MIDVTYIDHMGSDISVVNAARVSFGKKSGWASFKSGDAHRGVLKDTDDKLIKYLAKHKHMSPFGHCFATFHINAPLFVARQLVKHKFLRWNEISRRYVDSEPKFYEPSEWRGRSEDKKQGSAGTVDIYMDQEMQWHRQLTAYTNLINNGVCPEQARMVLPQSMMTEWYWSGSLDAFADMCNLRTTDDTQYETRLAATLLSNKMLKLFPVSWYELSRDKRR
jgi:thymidylate synthase (FAD)